MCISAVLGTGVPGCSGAELVVHRQLVPSKQVKMLGLHYGEDMSVRVCV